MENVAIKESKKQKKKMKTPNTYVIIFFILLTVAVLTWFIPGGAYKLDEAGQPVAGTYSRIASNPQGIWDILMAPITGMVGNDTIKAAIPISLNVMMFGSFLEMMDATGAINMGLKSVAKRYQSNYHVLITVLVFIMGIFGTVQGTYEEGFVYLLMFLPIFISLGLDSMTALMIVVFGAQAGCLSSIVNPFSTGISSGLAGISPGEGILYRTLIFAVLMVVVSFLICSYAKKVKDHPEKSPQYYRREQDIAEFGAPDDKSEMTSKQKVIFGLFMFTFVILIMGLVPWTALNEKWTFFKDAVTFLTGLPVIGMVLGKSMVPLGDWYFNEINVLLIVMTFVVGFIMKFDIDKSINIFLKGASALVPTAFIVPFARGIQVLMNNGNITSTILNTGEKMLGGVSPLAFLFICLAFYIVLACFIPSSSGLAAATISVMAPMAVFAGLDKATMIMIYNTALGVCKMMVPTSVILMTCIQVAHVDYGTWLKTAVKPVGVILIVSTILLAIRVLMIV